MDYTFAPNKMRFRFYSCPSLPAEGRECFRPFCDFAESCHNLAAKGETTAQATYDEDSQPPLFTLPKDILKNIAEMLSPSDFLNFMLSCKYIRSVCEENVIGHIHADRILVSQRGIFIPHRLAKPFFNHKYSTFDACKSSPVRQFLQSPFRLVTHAIHFNGEVTDRLLETLMARLPKWRVDVCQLSLDQVEFSTGVSGFTASAEQFARFLEHFSITSLMFNSVIPAPADYFSQMKNIVALKSYVGHMTDAHLLEMKFLKYYFAPFNLTSTVEAVNALIKQYLRGERDFGEYLIHMPGRVGYSEEGLVRGLGPLNDIGTDYDQAQAFFDRGLPVVKGKKCLLLARGEERVYVYLGGYLLIFYEITRQHLERMWRQEEENERAQQEEDSGSEDDSISWDVSSIDSRDGRFKRWFSGCFNFFRRARRRERFNVEQNSASSMDSSSIFTLDSTDTSINVVDLTDASSTEYSIAASVDPSINESSIEGEEPPKKAPGCFHWMCRFLPHRRTPPTRPSSPLPSSQFDETVDVEN